MYISNVWHDASSIYNECTELQIVFITLHVDFRTICNKCTGIVANCLVLIY